MNLSKTSENLAARVCLAAMAILAIGGIFFYKERSFFADTAYVLFHIINNQALAIQFNRYGAVITQAVPLAVVKLHLPLKAVLVAYSASTGIFYFSVAALLIYRFRQYGLMVLMALCYFVFVSQSFYWGSEIPQGLAWMFLMFGVALYMGQKGRSLWLIAIPFAATCLLAVFTHFSIMMAMLYLWVYMISDKERWPFKVRDSLWLSGLLLSCIGFKFYLAMDVNVKAGDGPILESVFRCSIRDIYGMFGTPVQQAFLGRCVTNYWAGVILFITGVTSLLLQRKYWLAIWSVLTCLGYMVIMSLTFSGWGVDAALFHIESEWLCMSVPALTPFALGYLPVGKGRKAVLFTAGVLLVRMVYIAMAATPFRWHIQFQERAFTQMEQLKENKVAFLRTEELHSNYILDWAAGYESMLASGLRGDRPQKLFAIVPPSDTAAIRSFRRNGFPSGFGMEYSMPFNHRYLDMDTVGEYRFISPDVLMKP